MSFSIEIPFTVCATAGESYDHKTTPTQKTNKMSKEANLQELAVAPSTEETLDNWVKVSACMRVGACVI